jgi:transcriptional regulator with XRE-family HTH domain
MKLNENIVRLRKQRGLTQEQLANILNVSVPAISKWENGNNRPDIEILPDLAEIFQVSIDALLGYEKSYKNLDKFIEKVDSLLLAEEYSLAIGELRQIIRSYPNDFRVNKLLADSYYSIVFSEAYTEDGAIDNSIFYYERSIELFEEKYNDKATIESLEIQIATLLMFKKGSYIKDAIDLIEKHNQNGKYDNLLAQCLYESGKKEEAKAVALKHCICSQVFVFNDFTTLADMFEKEGDYSTTIKFLEQEVELFKLFMLDERKGNYANRAAAGKAEIISKLYDKINDTDNSQKWHRFAIQQAKLYSLNPTMSISSLQYCQNVSGRMIDNYQDVIKSLCGE